MKIEDEEYRLKKGLMEFLLHPASRISSLPFSLQGVLAFLLLVHAQPHLL